MFLESAIKLGHQIVSSAEREDDVCFWKTQSYFPQTGIQNLAQISFYNGVSGIIYYLNQLYLATGSDKFLDYASMGGNWVLEQLKNTEHPIPGFFVGTGGGIYAIMQTNRLIGNKRVEEDVLKLTQEKSLYFRDNQEKFSSYEDIMAGVIGWVLGLLHLHNFTQQEWILKEISYWVKRSLDISLRYGSGLCWEKSPHVIQGLLGFSHGASGVGSVFAELGYYLSNDAFFEVTKLAARYEDIWFDQKLKNWPTFHGDFIEEENPAYYLLSIVQNRCASLLSGGDKVAWCHGAPGIGLNRIRWYEITKDADILTDISRALEKIIEYETNSPKISEHRMLNTLCHGRAGNILPLLEATRVLENPTYKEIALKIGMDMIHYKESGGEFWSGYDKGHDQPGEEDSSLFIGNAGIGSFFLHCAGIPEIGNPLFPTLPDSISVDIKAKYEWLSMSKEDLMDYLVRVSYPQSTAFISPGTKLCWDTYPDKLLLSLQKENVSAKGQFFEKTAETQAKIHDILKQNCIEGIPSRIFITFMYEIQQILLPKFSEADLLVANPFITTLDRITSFLALPENNHELAIVIHINELVQRIVILTQKPVTFSALIDELQKDIAGDRAELEKIINEQVLHLFSRNILLIHHRGLDPYLNEVCLT